MTPWRRRLRRLRIALTVSFACLIILAAVLIGVARLLLPQVGLHATRVAAFLSEQLKRPVTLDKVQGYWGDTGPVLRLEGVHIAASDAALPPLVIPEAELALDFGAWLGQNRRWSEFRLSGLDLTLERTGNGGWAVSGLRGGGSDGSDGDAGDSPLLMLGALVLRDTRVRLVDAGNAVDVAMRAAELRVLNWGNEHHVLGRVRRDVAGSSPLELLANFDVATRSGQLYLGSREVDLAALLEGLSWHDQRLASGRGRVQLWASMHEGELDSAHVALDLGKIETRLASDAHDLPQLPTTQMSQLSGVARWQRQAAGWSLDVADLRAARELSNPLASKFSLVRNTVDDSYLLHSEQIDLATVSAVAGLPGVAGDGLRKWLDQAAIHGQVQALQLRFVSRDDYDLRAHLNAIGVSAVDRVPGVERIDAELSADGGAIVLDLPGQAVTLNYPRKFRQPLAFDRLAGTVAAFPIDTGWRVETDALDIDGAGFALQLRGGAEFERDGKRPLLDAYALVMPTQVPAAKLFWPIGDMSAKSMAWLDRALVAGHIVQGRAALHGDLDDWPLRNLAGQFKAHAELADLIVDYSPHWPRAEGVNAVAEFVNTSLHVVATQGSMLGANATRTVADIPSFKDAVLALEVEGNGSGGELLAVLKASPLGTRYAEEMRGVGIGGSATVKFRLDMPLAPDVPGTVKGEVDLRDAAITAKKWNIDFSGASGKIAFNGDGFLAGPLQVGHAGHPAAFTLAVGGNVSDAANAVEARLQGNLPISVVFADFAALQPWWSRLPGSSDWDLNLAIPRDDATGPIRLVMSSELRGTALNLPAPLDKPAGDALPLRLSLQLPIAGSPMTLALGDVLRLRARLSDAQRDFVGALALGADMPAALPEQGLTLAGRARHLDISGWAGISLGAGPMLLKSIDVKADRAQLGGRDFTDLGLVLAHQPDQTGISLSGPQLQGTLQIPTADLLKRGITAQFERMHWPDGPKTPDGEEHDPLDGVIPATIPPLHLWIGDFRLGQANFGETRLESLPSGDGMRIEQFDTRSDDMQMHVRGNWNGDGQSHSSQVEMDLTSENLGRMLTALGFAGLFDGGQTLAHLDATWNGSPAAFALARLDGTLKINVNAGRVLDVEPGVGRLFGLFSVREIPRRLALDFGDFFRSGMSFNKISGLFELRTGSAHTQNLHIASPAADIRISGRTGLKAKDYDQQMVVTPRVGGTLPIVGAIAGGPAGAAAGLALQTLFNRAINQVTTARYHVTGSWDNPEITLISKESGKRREDG